MDKIGMREWVASLEGVIDNKLAKWKKTPRIENGEAVMLGWQFELTLMILYIFWEDKKEMVKFRFQSPRDSHGHGWSGLDDTTFDKIMDRIGNLAQIAMYRAIELPD